MPPLKYSGSHMFRQRIVAAILSNHTLKIDKIRENDDETPGLQDFEANFLRLIDQITDGTKIEINETGTTLRFKPGLLMGGPITHDCGTSRSMGWFIEGILPLAPFCKFPLNLTLSGITNDDLDLSVDILTQVTFPLLKNFGIYGIECKIQKRGMPPKGGGLVTLSIPPVRSSLSSIYIIDEGLVKRVRGTAFCTRISPTILTRVVESCRGVLNNFLPDVHIATNHFKGSRDGGDSPGYSLSLVAETTTGVLLSVERTAKPRRETNIPGYDAQVAETENGRSGLRPGEMPEEVGSEGAELLMNEIFSGGVVDRVHQPLILMLMVLTPEDVSKVRFGQLSPQTIETLRIIRDAFGVVFRIKEDKTTPVHGTHDGSGKMEVDGEEDDDDEEDEDVPRGKRKAQSTMTRGEEVEELPPRVTYLLSCLGIGYSNVNRRVT